MWSGVIINYASAQVPCHRSTDEGFSIPFYDQFRRVVDDWNYSCDYGIVSHCLFGCRSNYRSVCALDAWGISEEVWLVGSDWVA